MRTPAAGIQDRNDPVLTRRPCGIGCWHLNALQGGHGRLDIEERPGNTIFVDPHDGRVVR